MELTRKRLDRIQHNPGVYMFTRRGAPIYVGKAADLRDRLAAYTPGKDWKTDMLREATGLRIEPTDSELEAMLLEANWIKAHQPKYNISNRDQKSFLYIEITSEQFPQVRPTRTFNASGTYFGPFTSAFAVRETLRALRKIFSYRCNRKPIADSRQPQASSFKLQARPCLYFHLGQCAGTCAGLITAEQYHRRVIAPLTRLLAGQTRTARRLLDADHRRLLDEVLAHTRVLAVTEKYANDLQELQRVLHLPILPHRIEGYDISNIQGTDAVGSMVVAIDGEPTPSEYKRFTIRTFEGQSNDVGMLNEILGRRFIHAHPESSEPWPSPDLILIDGGKSQLNAVLRAMRRARIEFPVLALAKQKEEIYLPGQRSPLKLAGNSPALHLLQRVRDEAHRFAVSYHRFRRTKRLLR